MKIREIQEEILRLKKERDFCILAHSYQTSDILEIADFTGDSYALSVKAKNTPQKNVLMCGVRFMAETVKILSPEKNVYLSNPTAGCPMAEQMDKEMIRAVKMQYPDHTVVAYINTTAELKTICDVCVTSSSAVKIVSQLSNDKILFIPDCNLGAYVQQQLPDKKLKLLQGGCPRGDGTGGPGYTIKCETSAPRQRHDRGVLSMAHAGRDTGGSQFFICHKDSFFLDGQYAAFGRVVDGMDAVDEIAEVQTDYSDRPLTECKMKRVFVQD